MKQLLLAGVAVLALSAAAHAQQAIEWKQVSNLAKGLNVAKGADLSIVGIELGESYADAKAQLQKMVDEAKAPQAAKTTATKPTPNRQMEAMDKLDALERQSVNEMQGRANFNPTLEETKTQISFRGAGAFTTITAKFPGKLTMRRYSQSSGNPAQRNFEEIEVYLSAPSSGGQVTGITRRLSYAQSDQPRVGEFLSRVSEKAGSQPQRFINSTYRWQFNDGQMFAPANANISTCNPTLTVNSPEVLRQVNPSGQCDVVLQVRVSAGVTPDHASDIYFTLADHERLKQNATADFNYMTSYANGLGDRTRGAQPKL